MTNMGVGIATMGCKRNERCYEIITTDSHMVDRRNYGENLPLKQVNIRNRPLFLT